MRYNNSYIREAAVIHDVVWIWHTGHDLKVLWTDLCFKIKLKNNVMIVLALIMSLLIVFMITIFFGNLAKKNDIPVTPTTLQIKLAQFPDLKLQLQNIKLIEGYSSDYQ